eukprot:maker-scaffold83_size396513-snap-gene-1.19 protein:Tk00961 transcript:maker-scaffold83_size396513-snap-gene-1.19-mRNA-1 annotation:"tudor and kh domain-containing protein"
MVNRRTLWVGMGLGVGVAAVGGVIYALTRDELEEWGAPAPARPVVVELQILAENTGLVIGRRGETVQHLQRKTNTKIFFKDEAATETHRVIAIKGQRTDAQLAEILIQQLIANQPRLETVVMEIPNICVGRIIGRGGDTIRDLQAMSKCKIDVERREATPTGLKKVTLKGTSEQVEAAKLLITEKVAEDDQMREQIRISKDTRTPRLPIRPTPHLFLTSENGGVESDSSERSSSSLSQRTEKLNVSAGDKSMAVYVSAIGDPGLFYVQKVGPRSIDLDKLVEEMTSFYDQSTNKDKYRMKEAESGDLIAAQFEGDGRWYRAKVVKVIQDEYDEARVDLDLDFVDFGDCIRKPISEIRNLKTNFLRLNFQAIRCSLANTKPCGDSWSDEAADDFERLTRCAQWKEMLAEVTDYKTVDSHLVPLVHLVDTSEEEDIVIAQELVRLGHAQFIEPPTSH